jgi:peptidoglycan biosynthesis protein MviN/MurJ (putative lipid II flippase)
LRITLLLTIPSAVGFVVLKREIIQTIFKFTKLERIIFTSKFNFKFK